MYEKNEFNLKADVIILRIGQIKSKKRIVENCEFFLTLEMFHEERADIGEF